MSNTANWYIVVFVVLCGAPAATMVILAMFWWKNKPRGHAEKVRALMPIPDPPPPKQRPEADYSE